MVILDVAVCHIGFCAVRLGYDRIFEVEILEDPREERQ